MTAKEMVEIFSVWLLNWPNAENFKGTPEVLEAMAKLYANMIGGVDFWTAQRAAAMSMRTRVYPPNIGEFLQDIEAVQDEIRKEIDAAYLDARNAFIDCGGVNAEETDEILKSLPPRARKTIEAMGGACAFVLPGRFNLEGFRSKYEELMKTNPAMLPQKRDVKKISGRKG